MTESSRVNRLAWIDRLRALAIFGVVVVHSLGALIASPHGTQNWWIFNTVNSLAHCSVPVFLMISGALLLKQELPAGEFLRRRATRVLFPFLFWSMVLFSGNRLLDRPLSSDYVILAFLVDILENRINPIYWFVYVMIGLYLATPVLSKWIKVGDMGGIRYFVAIWIVSLFKDSYFRESPFDLTFFSGYVGYFVMGYYLLSLDASQKATKLVAMTLIVVGSTVTIFGNYLFSGLNLEYRLTPNIMVLSVGIFLFFKGSDSVWVTIADRMVRKISQYSYGIYLTHVVFISLLSRIGIDATLISPFVGWFIVAVLAISISILVIEVFRRFPLSKYTVGV